jgi:hypothetical protein
MLQIEGHLLLNLNSVLMGTGSAGMPDICVGARVVLHIRFSYHEARLAHRLTRVVLYE